MPLFFFTAHAKLSSTYCICNFEFFISFIISGLNGHHWWLNFYMSYLLAILKKLNTKRKFQNFVKFKYFPLLSLHTTLYIALYGNTRKTCIQVILKTYKNKLPDFSFCQFSNSLMTRQYSSFNIFCSLNIASYLCSAYCITISLFTLCITELR